MLQDGKGNAAVLRAAVGGAPAEEEDQQRALQRGHGRHLHGAGDGSCRRDSPALQDQDDEKIRHFRCTAASSGKFAKSEVGT